MAKKLMINCASCDVRKAQKETYEHYEKITINAATVLTNASGKAVLHALPVTLNCANVLEAEEDVEVRTVNGSVRITAADRVPEQKFILQVNGSLTIEAGTEAYLQQCRTLMVNGSVRYPESMAAFLGMMRLNGTSVCYPDGAVVLKRHAVIDRVFALRAGKKLYWSDRRMVMVDPELDPEQLRQKGCTFSAREAILARSKAEALLELIDEKTEIVIVPDGTRVIADDLTLDREALRRYGDQLYVIGDVTVPEEEDCLDSLRYLAVRGDVTVPGERRDCLPEHAEVTGSVKIARPRGQVLADRASLKITRWMLEQQPVGLEVSDCMKVTLSPDIPREMIAEKLQIADCGAVFCSEEQEDALSLVCTDVGQISTRQEETGGVGGTIRSVFESLAGAADTKVINAADYVL